MQSSAHTPTRGVHPVLIVLPLCLLGISVLFDAAGRLSGTPVWGILAFANLIVGILIAMCARGMQVAAYRGYPCRTSSYRINFINPLLHMVALVLFGISFVYRIHDPMQLPDNTAFLASVVGLFILALAGCLSARRPPVS